MKQRNLGLECDPEKVVNLHRIYVGRLGQLEELRRQKNANKNVETGRQLKESIREMTAALEEARIELEAATMLLPNDTWEGTPVGPEANARVIREAAAETLGPLHSDGCNDHMKLLKRFDWADFESASNASGEGFVYLKGDLALLEMSLIHFALRKAQRLGFEPMLSPEIVRDRVVSGCGFRPREGSASPIYSLRDCDTSLVGTAEIALAGLFADSILKPPVPVPLPHRMAAYSHAFRREAGGSARGLYRMHQFSKVELFVLATAQQSSKVFDELLEFQQSILEDLELPFRMLEMPTEELGLSAQRKVDCEVWMPSRKGFGEVSSASNCTDFQARRLNIRYQVEVGHNVFVHTLNATALAVPRIMIGILENLYDPKVDRVRLPKCLHGLMEAEAIPATRRRK